MKKYIKTFFSLSLILSIVLSLQTALGGKLESFLGAGEYLNVSCGNNDQNSNETIININTNERIQINCGILNSEEDTKNLNLRSGDNVKIICVPPEEYGDVVIPMALNDVQQVLCTSQDIE